MLVKVKQDCVGFIYGKLRKEGETFILEDEKQFSKNWMIELKEDKPVVKKSVKQSD